MTVFAIRNDVINFQELDLKIDDIIDFRPAETDEDFILDFSLNNCSMRSWWPTPDTEFVAISDDQNAAIPDICKWVDSSIVLSPKAFRFLSEILKEWGELLPIKIKNESFYIFNCLTFGSILESSCEKSYYEGEEFGIKSLVFDDEDISKKLIFKSHYDSGMGIYCGTRFKDVVLGCKLSGIVFSEKLVEDFS